MRLKETKRERFVRLAEKRTNAVFDKLRVLGGCANRQLYEYDEADVEKIRKAITDELNLRLERFSDLPEFALDLVGDSVKEE